MRLVASMITRDEMGRYLPTAVEHLLTFCDEIRILDDNSTDGGYEWMLKHDCVYVLTNAGPAFFEYESKARQALLEWTMEGSPDYVLSIDADEFVGDSSKIEASMAVGRPVYTLDMEEVWKVDDALHIRIDGQWGPRLCPMLWRAPTALNDVVWKIPDRQLACGREPLAVRRAMVRPSGTAVYHFGWTRQSEREARAERYAIHDRGRFHQNRHLQSILWPDEQVRLDPKPWPNGLESVRERIVASTRR